MKNNICIACAADEKFFEPLLVMLTSLNENISVRCNIYILDGGLSQVSRLIIRNVFVNTSLDIQIMPVDSKLLPENLKVSDNITLSSYYRLLLPELLDCDIDKVIYLDCDLIIEDDIFKLWNIPLYGKAIMAVPEMSKSAHFVSSPKGLLAYEELGIPEKNKYFNAGVLIINLKKWREEDISQKIFNYLEVYVDYVLWHDQDGLNAVLWNDWDELPSEWNVMTAFFNLDKRYIYLENEIPCSYIRDNIKILHYTNANDKPWNISSKHPLKNRYYYYKSKVHIELDDYENK